MTGKQALGEFEHHVLLALLHQGSEGYSVPVLAELEERTGREVSPAAVYIALRRLERKGLLTSHLRSAHPRDGGRERRYYSLTAEGMARLAAARESFLRLWDGLELKLEEAT
ncbi:PadR family transcriptional regulator [Gemmatimonadota bacterium]